MSAACAAESADTRKTTPPMMRFIPILLSTDIISAIRNRRNDENQHTAKSLACGYVDAGRGGRALGRQPGLGASHASCRLSWRTEGAMNKPKTRNCVWMTRQSPCPGL